MNLPKRIRITQDIIIVAVGTLFFFLLVSLCFRMELGRAVTSIKTVPGIAWLDLLLSAFTAVGGAILINNPTEGTERLGKPLAIEGGLLFVLSLLALAMRWA